MRWLVLVCAVLAGCASTTKPNYVRATGTGTTLEEAKQVAFRDAIEYQIGTLVLSERESSKHDLIKNQILVHSAGYVDDFKIVNTITSNGRVIVTVDVLVANSKINNQILSSGKSSKEFDGNRHNAQYSTLVNERVQGDLILDNFIKGYPTKAYTIKQQKYTVSVDNHRNLVLNVPYELSWNFEYIKSLRSLLDTIEDGSNGILKNSPGNITIMAKDPKDFVLGERTVHRFNDMSRINRIQQGMTNGNELRLKLTIFDYGNNRLFYQCWAPASISGYGSFYAIGSVADIRLYGNHKEKQVINFTVPRNLTNMLNRFSSVELNVVAERDCQK